MSILITGGNGYIASEIKNLLGCSYTIYNPGRTDLNLLNYEDCYLFFKNRPDIKYVIHTAIRGGSRLREDTTQDFYENLLMFENVKKLSIEFGIQILINISSGASFDRATNIECAEEKSIIEKLPRDYYGLSKNIIDKLILNDNTPLNILNLRIFGIFNKNELSTRFIKTTILKCSNNEDITVFKDFYFDFFSMEDFKIVIAYVLKYKINYRDINICYPDKYKLSEIAEIIKKKLNSSSKIIIHENFSNNYTGSSHRLDSLELNLNGFNSSIDNYIAEIIKK